MAKATTKAAEATVTDLEPQTASVGSSDKQPVITYIVERTAPEKLRRHDISDEDLDILGDMRRDHIWEGMWAALAFAAGAAPNAIAALIGCYASSASTPIGIVDLAQIIFMSMGIAVAIVLFIISKSRGKAAADKVTEIRARTAENVTAQG